MAQSEHFISNSALSLFATFNCKKLQDIGILIMKPFGHMRKSFKTTAPHAMMKRIQHMSPRTLKIPDIVHIGYPKAASTFVFRYLKAHPEVTTARNLMADPLLLPQPEKFALTAKPRQDKIHVTTDEGIAESVCVIGDPKNWHRFKFQPDVWDRIKNDIVVDPTQKALRLSKIAPRAKILMLIRDQAHWLESVYRYVLSDLPTNRRSFADFCATSDRNGPFASRAFRQDHPRLR